MIKVYSVLVCSIDLKKAVYHIILETTMLEVSIGPFVLDCKDFFKFYFYLMCMGILLACVSVHCVYTVLTEVRRGH